MEIIEITWREFHDTLPLKDNIHYKIIFDNGYRFIVNEKVHCEFGPADVIDNIGHYYLNGNFLFDSFFLTKNNIKPPTSLNEIKKIMLLM